ncbi:hypothetical protein AB0E96_09280 [Kitasatospora sp. NPDC036755]|uniref:hypothetical protein n=1 Tax=Kitasatospora sp. NPDC036755 TaxID=3154600 RepID=UPI0033DB29AF
MPKNPKPPRGEEQAAETLVNHVLGTETRLRDDNSKPGMPDLLLAAPSYPEPTIAVEITSTTDQQQARLWGFIDKKYSDEVYIELSMGWFVEFRPGAPVGEAEAKQLVRVLADLEARGVERVSVRDWDTEMPANTPAPEHITRLRALGLRAVAQIGSGPEVRGRIIPSTIATGTTPATAEAVTPYIDAFLLTGTAGNKLGKLQRAKDDGLHTVLFIWADSSHLSIGMALDKAFLPGGDPKVPQQVDEVWLASYFARHTLFRWTRTAGWAVVPVHGAVTTTNPQAE